MWHGAGFRSVKRWGMAVWLTAGLSACSGGDPAAGADTTAAMSAASAPRDAVLDAPLPPELERIERAVRARPAQMELQLRNPTVKPPAGSVAELQTLALRGLLAGFARDAALCEQISQQLRGWPAGKLRASAQLAAVSVAAEFQRQQGDVREAAKLLAAVEPALVANAGADYRWRYERQFAGVAGQTGQLDTSLAHAHAAVRLAEQMGRSWRVALSLLDLARTTERAESSARAKQILAQAQVEVQKDPDPMTWNQYHTMRGLLYANDDAGITLQAYTDALEQATLAGADSVRALNLANLTDYHLRQRNYERVMTLAGQALPLAQATNNNGAETVARSNIGLAKIATGRVNEGRNDVRAAITADEQLGALSDAADGLEELASYLERAGDLAGAVDAYRDYRSMIERVLRDDIRKAVLEAQEREDAEQRARDIELLNRDNALKGEQVNQRNLALALWAVLGACVLVSLALLVQAFRRVRRTNEALAHSNASLKHQSETDPLTGLANRRHFQAAIKSLSTGEGLAASVFLIDVDHFKRINDSFGHAAGDRVLVEISSRLRQAVRDDDLIVRWGGEEFLIAARTSEAHAVSSADQAAQLAQRLLDLIGRQPVSCDGRDIIVTASIGFISLPVPPNGLRLSWERAIDLVDTVMYLAKAHGRNKAYGVERIDAEDALAVAQLTARLEAAWSEGQVSLLALDGPVTARALDSGLQALDGGATPALR